jgi:hypothetical protein
MTHAELLRRMSTREFSAWAALYLMEAEDRQRAMRDAERAAKRRR